MPEIPKRLSWFKKKCFPKILFHFRWRITQYLGFQWLRMCSRTYDKSIFYETHFIICLHHSLQMFDNISSLRFIKGSNLEMFATAMISSEQEIMEFRTPVIVEGRVEDWMTKVEMEMRRTNRLITKESIYFYRESKIR